MNKVLVARTRASQLLSLATALMAFSLSGCLGCGGDPYIQADLERGTGLKQPAWVGVYYLSQESALDGMDPTDLVSRTKAEEKLAGVQGIVMKEIHPIYPDQPMLILKEKPDKAIRWVVIVSNLKGGKCSIEKVALGDKKEVKIHITVEEECLVVKKTD